MIATFHHLACTGGTIITKCVAAMDRIYALSEIHPYTISQVGFVPLAAGAQFQSRYGALTHSELRMLVLAQLRILVDHSEETGHKLIIRDHAHSDFVGPSAHFECSLLLTLAETDWKIRSIVSIRDPVETYISLCAKGWQNGLDFDGFCDRWLRFINAYDKHPLFHYEEFCDHPTRVLTEMCNYAGLPFDQTYSERLAAIVLTGDSGRTSNVIAPRPRKTISDALAAEIEKSSKFAHIVDRWPRYGLDYRVNQKPQMKYKHRERKMRNDSAHSDLQRRAKALTVSGRTHVLELINLYELKGEAAEVGTFNGTFADEILRNTNVSKLSCIDPYAQYDEFNDAINKMDMDAIMLQAQRFLSGFGERVVFIREFSELASMRFPDGSLDFVYVDGNHQSKFVSIDLSVWWPKVRQGGLLIGDDCVDLDDSQRNAAGDVTLVHSRKPNGAPDLYGDYGVFHALRAFVAQQDLGYLLMGSQFVIPK